MTARVNFPYAKERKKGKNLKNVCSYREKEESLEVEREPTIAVE